MKLIQDEKTGFVMQNSRRIAFNKKLQLRDGDRVALLTAKQIADLAHVSLSHAYRIVKDPDKHLTATVRELLVIKAIGQIPGWLVGWRFDALNQRIITPDGKTLHCMDLENYALAQQLLANYENVTEFSEKRIKELEARLKLPRELRLYVNDTLKQRRTLTVQSRAALQVVNG